MKRIVYLLSIGFVLLHPKLSAQELVSCGGQYVTGATGSFAASLGEIVFPEITSPQQVVTFGFQQAESDNFSATSLVRLHCSVYPNPVVDDLHVKIVSTQAATSYQLIGSMGETVQSGCLRPDAQLIMMGNYPPGIYFLQLQNGQSNYTTKIIKK